MAKFKCPHCGDIVELKVFLKDITHAKTLDPDAEDIVGAIAKAFADAVEDKESPNTVAKVSTRVRKQSDALSGLYGDMLSDLMEKRESAVQNGEVRKMRPEDYESEDSTYLSEEKVATGENIVAKMNKLFGGQ